MAISNQHTDEKMNKEDHQQKHRNIRIVVLVVVLVVCLAGAAFGGIYLARQQFNSSTTSVQNQSVGSSVVQGSDSANGSESVTVSETETIDFDTLEEQNSDIYAWIRVPGTLIDYPILRNEDNSYYLTHDVNKEISVFGAVFTESYNTLSFQDNATIVYGHDASDGSMFATLHNFSNESFFDEHDTFYIYLPGHTYTYKILSAFTTDDRHLMYAYNGMKGDENFATFIAFISSPSIIRGYARELDITTDDKVVVLSTCMSDDSLSSERYLVCGVMIHDQSNS